MWDSSLHVDLIYHITLYALDCILGNMNHFIPFIWSLYSINVIGPSDGGHGSSTYFGFILKKEVMMTIGSILVQLVFSENPTLLVWTIVYLTLGFQPNFYLGSENHFLPWSIQKQQPRLL